LFDLENDPYEMNDVAAVAGNKGKVAELMVLLREQQKAFEDPFPLEVSDPKPAEVDLEFFQKEGTPDPTGPVPIGGPSAAALR